LGLSLIITALLALVASALFTQFSYNTVVSELQGSSAGVANNLANSIARDLPDMATPNDLRQIAQRSGINALFAVKVTGLPIKSVVVYDDAGQAAYANDPDWIGVNVDDRNLFTQAMQGTTVTDIRTADDPPTTYQAVNKVDVVEAYAPIRPSADSKGNPIGVLLTVSEAPEISKATLNARLTGLLTAATTMGLLFLALLTVVNRADSILAHRAAELATAYKNLREAEAMRDDLTNMIMHDLRNPLTAISASLDFVNQFTEDTQAAARTKMIGNAQAATDRMTGMIEDLLTVSKIEAGQLNLQKQTTNLSELLTEAVSTFTSQANHDQKTLTLDCSPKLLTQLDQPLMRRVIENLIGNALKYTDMGSGKIQVLAGQSGSRIVITVRDNGQGIPAEHKQRVFEKFVQLTPLGGEAVRKGAGLGLAFCRLVVRQHGGDINVQDAPGGGSDFVVWLPA
jgi:signal transduction histidine kinase